MRKGREPIADWVPVVSILPVIGGASYNQVQVKKMYKKYHPEVKKPKARDMYKWVNEEVEVPQDYVSYRKLKNKKKK